MRGFICQIVPQSAVMRYPVSQAANLFCRRLIATGAFDEVVSLVPVAVGETIAAQEAEKITYIQSRRFRWLHPRKLGELLDNFRETFQAVRAVRKCSEIWFYNLNASNYLTHFLLRRVYRKRVFVVLADFTPPEKRWSVSRVFLRAIQHSSGVLALSARLSFPVSNVRVIPGIVSETARQRPYAPVNGNRDFLFSGTLAPVNGIADALKTFAQLPAAQLRVSGRDVSGIVAEYAEKYPNISFWGMLSLDEYERRLGEIAFAVNFRDPELPENRNNFPSKLLEYFSWGKVVFSTIDYPELAGFRYFHPAPGESAATGVERMLTLTDAEIGEIAEHNRRELARFNESSWREGLSQVESFAKE